MTSRSHSPFVILLAIGVSTMGGCGHPAERKLQGRWQGERIETTDSAELSAATGWVKGTSFLFKGEHMTVEIPAESPRTGKFEVLAYRDGKVTVGVERNDGLVDRVELMLDDDRLIRWQLPGGRAIWMRRSP